MKKTNFNRTKTIARLILVVVFFVLNPTLNFSQITGDPLLEDTSNNVIHFLGADSIIPLNGNINVAKIVGNARFMQDSVFMRSDFALLDSKLQFLKAIGNVRINQGDSLFLYGDSLDYNGETKIAIVRGNLRLIENDLTLTAPSIRYDLNTSTAYYIEGGTVVSKKNQNTLTSDLGYYFSGSKTLSFKGNVTLNNPEYRMNSDTLDYNEISEIAYFSGNTFIKGEGNLIFCKNGYYDTRNDISEFNKDAYLISDGHTILGDKLYYDRKTGLGIAKGNIRLEDSVNQIIVTGDYGTRNEKNNLSFVTGNTLVSKWFEDNDTLFLSADTIKVFKIDSTKMNQLFCFNDVRIFKNDLQGICDSMVYLQSDSLIQLFVSPYIWSENSQMNGDTIIIQLSSKRIKELLLRNNSFIADAVSILDTAANDTIPSGEYNQIKGKNVKAIFTQDTIRTVYVTGNGQSIYFTQEDLQPSQGLNKIDCSEMNIKFENGKIRKIAFVNSPDGILLPIQDAREEDKELKGFSWKLDLRPLSKNSLIK
ncbi:MAG: OstA-like protein [Flavobacteriales bacterium]